MSDSQDIELLKQLKTVEYHQYEFIIVTALGVLGFSIERFDVSHSYQYLWILIASWFLLLTSVLEGFFQIQWRLAIDVAQYKRRPLKSDVSKYKQALIGFATIVDEDGLVPLSSEELKSVAAKKEGLLSRMDSEIKKQGELVYKWTRTQVWSFYLGIILLVVFKILNTI